MPGASRPTPRAWARPNPGPRWAAPPPRAGPGRCSRAALPAGRLRQCRTSQRCAIASSARAPAGPFGPAVRRSPHSSTTSRRPLRSRRPGPAAAVPGAELRGLAARGPGELRGAEIARQGWPPAPRRRRRPARARSARRGPRSARACSPSARRRRSAGPAGGRPCAGAGRGSGRHRPARGRARGRRRRTRGPRYGPAGMGGRGRGGARAAAHPRAASRGAVTRAPSRISRDSSRPSSLVVPEPASAAVVRPERLSAAAAWFERPLPRDRTQLPAVADQRLGDTLVDMEGLVGKAALVAQPAIVDLVVVARQHPQRALVADGEGDVALRRAQRAHRPGVLDVPGPGTEAVGARGQGPHRAQLDDVARGRGRHRDVRQRWTTYEWVPRSSSTSW